MPNISELVGVCGLARMPMPFEPKSRAAVFLAPLVTVANKVGHLIEKGLLSAAEALWRTRFRLDPRLYSERGRIRSITEGLAIRPSNKFAVFLIYAPSTIPDFTINLVDALNRAAYNLIVVSNAQLDSVTRANLLTRCRLLVERVNFGRDFGGYKDGISIAFRRFPNIERLIVANDSVFYFESGLDELVRDLERPEDFIGVSETLDHHYHVASFLLSFGPRVLRDPVFRQFWESYLPISTRMWVVLEGEGALTKRLVDAGYRPHILFRAEQLVPKLQILNGSKGDDAMALFPRRIRKLLSVRLDQGHASVDHLAAAVVEEVLKSNQMHAAGFAFMKLLGLPLFKRDIAYRQVYTLSEVKRIVSDLGLAMQADIIDDLGRRTPPLRMNVVRSMLYRHWFI